MLRVGVRTALRPFRDYLVGLHGDSVKFSKEKCLYELTEKTCYLILRNPGIAAVFGGAKKGSVAYPYANDPAEDLLVEEASKQLMWVDNSQSYITRERISNLQRAALRGTEAIAAAIEFEEANARDDDLDTLITKCYTWGTALASLRDQTRNHAPAPANAPTGYGR
jgi:hypothetical protein